MYTTTSGPEILNTLKWEFKSFLGHVMTSQPRLALKMIFLSQYLIKMFMVLASWYNCKS